MGKYDALGTFLRRWKVRNDVDGVELSFAQIEGIIRGGLPRGAADAQWWRADGQPGSPHRRAWIEAGFEATADLCTERVYFRRQKNGLHRVD
ncbi:DUF7662 domain-containing protein [Sphingopyxis sp.]|jgi:hypothetical protein|uniref:DUF7662 domain-containing protein n=1 Tax=Sphingopyxis sp. TaxID=1908224 RepID=UPI003F7283B2